MVGVCGGGTGIWCIFERFGKSGKHINHSDQSECIKQLQSMFDATWKLLVTAHGGDWSLAYAQCEKEAGRLKMQRNAYIKKHGVFGCWASNNEVFV